MRERTRAIMLTGATLALALALFVCISPTAAAVEENYGVWCDGAQFTSGNKNMNLPGGGTASFNNATSTLTLTDAVITNGCTAALFGAPGIYTEIDLNIVIVGDCIIDVPAGACIDGSSDYYLANITITGSGAGSSSLTMIALDPSVWVGYGVYAGELIVEDLTIYSNTHEAALAGEDGLCVTDCNLVVATMVAPSVYTDDLNNGSFTRCLIVTNQYYFFVHPDYEGDAEYTLDDVGFISYDETLGPFRNGTTTGLFCSSFDGLLGAKWVALDGGVPGIAFGCAWLNSFIAVPWADYVMSYRLTCNGYQFAEDLLSVNCGSGTAVFNPATKTLTLTNAYIDEGLDCGQPWGYPAIHVGYDLTIMVVGDCVIDIEDGTAIDTICNEGTFDVTIIGTGASSSSLSITSLDSMNGYGIWAKNVSISDLTLYIFSSQTGIMGLGDVTITDSIVVIENDDYTSNGIGAAGIDHVYIHGSVVVGNRPNLTGMSSALINSFGSGSYVLDLDGMLIWYNPYAGTTFIVGTSDSMDFDCDHGTAVWALNGTVSGIEYASGSLSGFVAIPNVNVVTVPVEIITVEGEDSFYAIVGSDTTLQMVATVLPYNATDKSVSWSVIPGTGSATISSSGLLTGVSNGTVTVRATANDGSGIYGETVITIAMDSGTTTPVPVSSITVSGAGGATSITVLGGTLQMGADVLPTNADDRSVTWSIESGSEFASISSSGLLTAIANGTVTVKATANDGSNVAGIMDVTISGQDPVTCTCALCPDCGGCLEDVCCGVGDCTPCDCAWTVSFDTGTGGSSVPSQSILKTGNGKVTEPAGPITRTGYTFTGWFKDSACTVEWDFDVDTVDSATTIYAGWAPVVVDPVPVTGITVTAAGGASGITARNGTLQMVAAVQPSNADDSRVVWSVINGTGSAQISVGGILTATTNGTVTVRATANDGSGVYGEFVVTITGQVQTDAPANEPDSGISLIVIVAVVAVVAVVAAAAAFFLLKKP